MQTAWSMEAPPAPEHPNKPWVTEKKETTMATEKPIPASLDSFGKIYTIS